MPPKPRKKAGKTMVKDFVSVDLETTGLMYKEDGIIEIAAVRFRDGKEDACFHTYVNPGRKVPERITELTGITGDMIADAPQFGDIYEEVLEFIGDDVLMAHHISFDYAFLKRAVINHASASRGKGGVFEKKGIDTLKIARAFLPTLESRSLGELCRHYGIPILAHKAEEDARATALLYLKLWETFGDDRNPDASMNKLFEPYPLIYKVKKECPATRAQKERLYRELDKHKIVPEYDVERLTKNEASRYLDRILSEYGR